MGLKNGFKELGQFSKDLQIVNYERVYSASKLPIKAGSEMLPEVILFGKSNVGKSTLINTLLNHSIATTSKSPGCTKWIGYIKLKNLVLIDLPGYGFSTVSKGRKTFWNTMITEYIAQQRTDLALILVDSRRGICEIDAHVASLFGDRAMYVYTKYDKKGFVPAGALATSTKTGTGIIELRQLLVNGKESQFI